MDKDRLGHADEIILTEKYSHHIGVDYDEALRTSDIATPITKKKTIFTRDLLKRMTDNSVLGSEVMPVNCRYLEKTSEGYIVVIEEPPAMRTVTIRKGFSYEWESLKNKGILDQTEYKDSFKNFADLKEHKFTLAFPYVIFVLYIDNSYGLVRGSVFARPQQLSGLTDYLCKMPLTNISDDQHVCFGDGVRVRERSLSAAVSNTIMVFWSAAFNTDYTYNLKAYNDTPVLGNYLEWAHMSKTNPMFIYTADWIHHSTIDIQISRMRAIFDERRGGKKFDFKDLSNLFYRAQDTGTEEKVAPKGRKKHKLFYDICQGMHLDSNLFMNVGDTIKMNNGDLAYVDTFIGFMNGGEVRYIGLDYKGKQLVLKYHANCRNFLIKNLNDQRNLSEITLPNGTVIKPGDILVTKNKSGSDLYQKVHYIRKSRGEDDTLNEIRMGNAYYFANNIDAQVFDIKNPVIAGIQVNKGDTFIITHDSGGSALISAGEYKYDSIDVDGGAKVIAKFRCINKRLTSESRTIRLSNPNSYDKLIPSSEVRRMNSKVYRIGRKLLSSTWDGGVIEDAAWAKDGRMYFQNNYRVRKPEIGFLKELVKDNKFSVNGADFDINFEMGDKVVVANWKSPLDVLNVKTICGFKFEEHTGDISFILTDKNEQLSEVKYVDGQQGHIFVGKIRKVTNKFDKLSAGTKIIAKEAGVYAFPKKDVNIVVAIIIDSPFEPMVLCSNGCTLWYSDVMTKFTKVTMKAKKWASLQHVPLDVSKIKFQAGDIVVGQMNYTQPIGFMLWGEITRQLKATPLEYYSGHPDHYSFDRYFQADAIFDCIPSPRISPKAQGELGYKRGYLDFHGNCLISEVPESSFLFINDRGI